MIILRKVEADVLELLRKGESQRRIAMTLNLNRGTVISLIARLSELSVIESTGRGNYRITSEQYKIIDRKNLGSRGTTKSVEISDDQELYIRGHYEVLTRTRIARRLGIGKVTLNLMILQLGLGE